VTLGTGCAYLLANSAGSTTGDQGYGTGITDDGGIAVLTPGLAIVDAVGQSAGSAYKEGEPLAPTTANADQPYERQAATRASRACASTRSRAPRTSRPTINTEFADQVSDHDPPIVRFRLRR
jgi:hypothetical protein